MQTTTFVLKIPSHQLLSNSREMKNCPVSKGRVNRDFWEVHFMDKDCFTELFETS